MKKYICGTFNFNKEIFYYTNDFITFYKEDELILTNEDLEEWSVWLNSPWSQAHERYEISCNCKDGYTEMDKDDFLWKCEYSIVGYDGISASIFGYGNTEEESLIDCKKHFKYLQDNYNKEDESV